ncbi:MAG: hypothetical protein IJ456_07595 [Bacteroides sp.]|nr:hypothetical protein [Bacteroides sp.]
MRKRMKKSVWMPLALFVYTTAMAVYFLPRNTEISDKEKWGTIGMSYLVIALLWFVLRKREKRLEEMNRKIEETYKDKTNN